MKIITIINNRRRRKKKKKKRKKDKKEALTQVVALAQLRHGSAELVADGLGRVREHRLQRGALQRRQLDTAQFSNKENAKRDWGK